jgi:hypothetical protein
MRFLKISGSDELFDLIIRVKYHRRRVPLDVLNLHSFFTDVIKIIHYFLVKINRTGSENMSQPNAANS